ncbi:MAG: hypothetical protein AB8G22_19380 [Saprospiraceae bacterium]
MTLPFLVNDLRMKYPTSNIQRPISILLHFAFYIFLTNVAFAQPTYPIGGWQSYLPFRNGVLVTQSNEQVIYATNEAIFTLDKADLAVDFLTKTDGLSNVGVRQIKYNQGSETLIVVYDNSVIDLVRTNEIITLNDIKNFNNIIGRKEVNNIFIENAEQVYLATSFGISRLNVVSGLFEFTTFTGVEVNDVAVFNNKIYIATEEGIYRVATDNFNIDDFSNWTYLNDNVGLPMDYSASILEVFNGKLYLGANDVLYQLIDDRVEEVHTEEGFKLAFSSAENEHLLVGYECGSCDGKVLAFNADNSIETVPNGCVARPQAVVEDEQGRIWFADRFDNIRYANSINDGDCRLLSFNSPLDNNVQDIAVTEDKVWVATGGVNPTFNYLFRQTGFYSFGDGDWTAFNRNTTPAIKAADLFDFYTMLTHPETGDVYAGSFYDGLVIFNGEDFTIYDDSNSSLNNPQGDADRTRVSGLAFDGENNLWVSNHAAQRPFSVLTNAGEWQNFSTLRCAGNDVNLLEVLVDENGFKWFTSSSTNTGLLVYDTGDLADTGDDRCRVFTASNSDLPTNQVNDVALDLDGDIWVGTAGGVVVFQCGPQVFEDCNATEVITDQDATNLGLLLSGDEVKAVAVDGANNKWFGTTNGVFVQSPDGKDQLAHFTVDNSPLLSNTITDITIRQATGEVFIGTTEGLMSYRTEATTGGRTNSINIYAFPNPVRPEYDGPIAITGLAQDANVKITDVNGQLIYETRAQGGQAVWDGNDYNGRRASTGVYLVFSTSKNLTNPDAAVTKILFVK